MVILSVSLILCCTACGKTYQEATGQVSAKEQYSGGYFTIIYEWKDSIGTYYIVYANDTKVKYFVVHGQNRSGITPLYNADGTLQLYEGE